MAGSLIHSRVFCIKNYIGNDGRPHYEVRPVDGETDVTSYSNWRELLDYAASHGVPIEVWPDFTDFELAIDVPLAEVSARQDGLKQALRVLPSEVVARNVLLARILGYLDKGEQVFFC